MAFKPKTSLVMALSLTCGLAACQTTAGNGDLYGNSSGIDRFDRGRVVAQQPYRDRSGRVLYPTSDGRAFYSARERDIYLADLRQSRDQRLRQRERELERREARQRELERREARQRDLERREARDRELARAQARQRQREFERGAAREGERRNRTVREDRRRAQTGPNNRRIEAAEDRVAEARRDQRRAQRVLERRRAAGANVNQATRDLRAANERLAAVERNLRNLRQRNRQAALSSSGLRRDSSDYETYRRRGESPQAFERRVRWAQAQVNRTGMSIERILREGRGPADDEK
ncbi:MAG: hypothetical protein AAF415_04830 [Pseudomonadota bacterium]